MNSWTFIRRNINLSIERDNKRIWRSFSIFLDMTDNIILCGKETCLFRKKFVRKKKESGSRKGQEGTVKQIGNTRNRDIWSAKYEEFPRVALSVISIDTTSIYHRRGVWLDSTGIGLKFRGVTGGSFVATQRRYWCHQARRHCDDTCPPALRYPYTL